MMNAGAGLTPCELPDGVAADRRTVRIELWMAAPAACDSCDDPQALRAAGIVR